MIQFNYVETSWLWIIKNDFECGNIHIDNKKENGYKFSVNRLEDILTKITPKVYLLYMLI